ncbi:MAG: c-type cytochrome [Nitrospiraceae bacterium]
MRPLPLRTLFHLFPFTFSLLVVCLAMGSTGSAATALSGAEERGKVIFEKRCASCHGPQGRGDGPEAPFLSPRPSSLISAATSVKTDEELSTTIENGKPRTAMRAWKDELTEEQRRDVLAYIRSLVRFYNPVTPQTPPQQK